jgi:hypothetical protein
MNLMKPGNKDENGYNENGNDSLQLQLAAQQLVIGRGFRNVNGIDASTQCEIYDRDLLMLITGDIQTKREFEAEWSLKPLTPEQWSDILLRYNQRADRTEIDELMSDIMTSLGIEPGNSNSENGDNSENGNTESDEDEDDDDNPPVGPWADAILEGIVNHRNENNNNPDNNNNDDMEEDPI